MPDIVHIKCRLQGHRTACTNEATLLPEGGGLLHHQHECLRCGEVEQFEVEDLPPELDSMLRMTFRPSRHAVTVQLGDTVSHKPLVH